MSATKAQVRTKIKQALSTLEEARRMMVEDDLFTSAEVHQVAIAQYEVGRTYEKLDPRKKT